MEKGRIRKNQVVLSSYQSSLHVRAGITFVFGAILKFFEKKKILVVGFLHTSKVIPALWPSNSRSLLPSILCLLFFDEPHTAAY